MGHRPVLVLAASAALIGCAALRPPKSDPAAEFAVQTRWFTARAILDGNQLFGRGVDVVHEGDGYRGMAGDRLVHLSAQGNRLVGLFGQEQAALQVDALPDGVLIHGAFGGEDGAVALLPDRVVGRIGSCVYDFVRPDPAADWLVSRWSGRGGSPVRLALPHQLGARPLQERGAFLAFFLMQMCGRIGGPLPVQRS